MLTTLFSLFVVGCVHPTPTPLDPSDRSTVDERVAALERSSELVYTGVVRPRDAEAGASYTYRRYVHDEGTERIASHVTYEGSGEEVLVLHQTRSGPAGLRRFDEWHGQTGLVGSVEVDDEHTATFDVVVRGKRTRRIEPGRVPVHAGPTLFGFVLDHWDTLSAGGAVPLRFAVLADARTYRFVVRRAAVDEATVVFRLRASDPLVRIVVPPMDIVFDRHLRAPVRYEGLVPPSRVVRGRLRPFDARVDYTLTDAPYR